MHYIENNTFFKCWFSGHCLGKPHDGRCPTFQTYITTRGIRSKIWKCYILILNILHIDYKSPYVNSRPRFANTAICLYFPTVLGPYSRTSYDISYASDWSRWPIKSLRYVVTCTRIRTLINTLPCTTNNSLFSNSTVKSATQLVGYGGPGGKVLHVAGGGGGGGGWGICPCLSKSS